MDILSHTLTGVAVSTVVISFSSGSIKTRVMIILCGTLGGALPDIDTFSYWSGFDTYIGNPLGLAISGREIYYGKFWFSHHGMMHSLFMAFLLPVIHFVITGLFKPKQLYRYFGKHKLKITAFVLAYSLHLVQDMITPSSSWGGVRLLFPITEYFGGYGKIWWWNNYDLTLIIVTTILLNSTVLLLRYKSKVITPILFTLGLLLFSYQVYTRDSNFRGRSQYSIHELKSKQIQKNILGLSLYNNMERFDNSIPINF